MSKKFTTIEFISRAKIIHKDKYNYSLVCYTKSTEKVKIICPIHGIFEQEANSHLQNSGCQKCHLSKISQKPTTQEEFIVKCKIAHGDEYDYSKTVYLSSDKKVIITCKIHGDFEQEANAHISQKSGCSKCYGRSGFSRKRWVEYCEEKEGIFYIIECWNESERFYKIGITSSSVKERYNHISKMPYNFNILKEVKSFDLDYIWSLEKQEKRRLRSYKYEPNIRFAGFKECFKTDLENLKL